MRIDERIDREVKKRAEDIDRGGNIRISLPNTGIIYFCSRKKIPLDLGSIAPEKIEEMRKRFWEELNRGNKNIDFWSYEENGKEKDYDAIVDSFRISSKQPRFGEFRVYAEYYTQTDSEFLNSFLDRSVEVDLLNQTVDFGNPQVLQGIENMIDDYLVRNHQISLADFKAVDLSKIPGYENMPTSYARTDFNQLTRFYLGILASMHQDNGIDSESFFRDLTDKTIYPKKRNKKSPMFDFIRKRLLKPME